MAVLTAALAFAFAGCGIERDIYPSPEVGLSDAKYQYRAWPSEMRGSNPGAPTGVEFERVGVRVAVGSPRRLTPLRDAAAGVAAHPEPVCMCGRAVIVIPPLPWIFTSDVATARFEIEIAITGADATFDPSRVTLESDASGNAIAATLAADERSDGDEWTLRFETPCDPDATYILRVGGVARDGVPIDVPAIRFAPTSIWTLASINGGVVLWPLGEHW